MLAEAEDDSGAEAEIVLAVVEAVGNFCQKVFGLQGRDREVPGDFEVHAATGGQREMALLAGLRDPRAC
jgi:hypothetical protein